MKTEMSLKLKCHQIEMSPTAMQPKLKLHPKYNIIKTEMSPTLKLHPN